MDEIEVPDVTRCPQCGGEGRLLGKLGALVWRRWCPQCGGEGRLLGKLGALVWRRCRNCGAEWNDTGTIHEEAPR